MGVAVVGLGLYREQLTLGAMDILRSGLRVALRTGRCEAARWLDEHHIDYEAFDALYDAAEDFDQLNRMVVERVLELARTGDLVYGVLDVRDESVMALSEMEGVRVIPGVPVDAALLHMSLMPAICLAACDARETQFEAGMGVLAREITSRELAGELKLKLMERFPDGHRVQIAAGDGGMRVIALEDLDRLEGYDHATCAYLHAEKDLKRLERYGFHELNRVVRILRGPNGCPWDKAQTHESLRTNVVEEAWEVVDAIENGDPDALYDELGDLLMQAALHAEIARQHGEFDIDDVTDAITRKLIHRHKHIFSGATAGTPEEVLNLWEEVKREDRGFATRAQSMRAVTKALPAMMRAEKMLKKAGEPVWDARALLVKQADALMEGTGDLEEMTGEMLLTAVRLARAQNIKPELALNRALAAFSDRVEREDQE